jgi:ABC-2 type transport system ATP-binding protein
MNWSVKMDSIVRLTDLRKVYTEFVLRDITWEIPKGFIMGLIGPNGAGKSTTIKLLMSLIRPDGGEVEVFGLTYRDAEIEIKNRVGYVGEEQPFYEHRYCSIASRSAAPRRSGSYPRACASSWRWP